MEQLFTSNTSTFNFNTNDQSIGGANAFTMFNVVCGTSGKTLTNSNLNGTTGVTISGTLSGAGNFTNAGILTFSGATPMTLTGTPDFATNVNTVIYNATVAQTVAGVAPSTTLNFYNLTVSGARTTNNVTFWNTGTIGVSNTFTPNATFSTGNYVPDSQYFQLQRNYTKYSGTGFCFCSCL
ncbi:MAG: hypothetical protein U0X76_11025 [Bacteroidia bacterium]